jgi:diguanylate cyclase (GGDEF)-like protein
MLHRTIARIEAWPSGRARPFPAHQRPMGRSLARLFALESRKRPARATLELPSAFTSRRAEDRELDEVLRALNELSASAKAGSLDTATLDHLVKRVAQSARKQSILGREVRSLAVTDELTGFFNRRGFMAAAAQQLKLARRDRQNVVLLFCDVDNLKGINDSFGHREGDLALFRVAGALEETFRDSDVLARLGGDEFAILAWEASVPDVETMLSRLGKHLKKVNAHETRYHLSLSAGVARFDPHSPVPLGELIAVADQDMYRHKSQRHFEGAGRRS